MDGGKPQIGRGAQLLGVRFGPLDQRNDICPDGDGFVHPGQGGMSVSPSVETLPPHRLPRRLREKYPDRFPDASASNGLHCWRLGTGAFAPERVADRMFLRVDSVRHGLVEPDAKMKAEDYEQALVATRDQ